MKIQDYLKAHKLWVVSNIIVLFIVNSIYISTVVEYRSSDLLYMNGLLIIIQLSFLLIGFWQQKNKYNKAMKSSMEELEKMAIHDDDYIINMLYTLLQQQRFQHQNNEEAFKKKINEIQDYITQWVHDIKVNIAVCDLLLDETEDIKVRDLRNQIEQIKFRVNQTLYITRANHYSQDTVAERIDVGQVLRMAIKENALFLINKDITINTDLHHITVINDKRWVYYIFTQILNNSSKYTQKGGTVQINSEEDDHAYYIYIKDDGIGIPKEDLGRIFDKGFTGKNGKNVTKSTGMGLYYTKKISEMLQIGIDVKSEEGEYTAFTIIFYKLSDYFNIASNG
ncbi:sensor histidine kinase [Virgibacillus salarius]